MLEASNYKSVVDQIQQINWTWCYNPRLFLFPTKTPPRSKFVHLLLPVVAAVINPLFHDGVVCVQVDGHVFVLWIQHVAKLLQPTVFWAATCGVPQVVHNVRHIHFTWKMDEPQRHMGTVIYPAPTWTVILSWPLWCSLLLYNIHISCNLRWFCSRLFWCIVTSNVGYRHWQEKVVTIVTVRTG